MSDTFGLLELPVPVPETDEEAAGDPVLDTILSFAKAVVNADVGDAWAARNPADPLPIAHTFAHDPDPEVFDTNATPALYLWRADDTGGKHRYSQDLTADEGGFSALWVPPPMPQEHKAARAPLRNAIKKSLRQAFAQGRHAAWIVPDDDYYNPELYGSVLLYHAKLGKLRLGSFKSHTLVIESEDRGAKTVFECLFFSLEALEFFSFDPSAHAGHGSLEELRLSVELPEREIEEDEEL